MPIYTSRLYKACCDRCDTATQSVPSNTKKLFVDWLRQLGWTRADREWLCYECSKRQKAKATP